METASKVLALLHTSMARGLPHGIVSTAFFQHLCESAEQDERRLRQSGSIVRYEQVGEIYQAMRDLEEIKMLDEDGGRIWSGDDISTCFTRIRAALEGKTPESNARPFNLYEAGREGFLQAKLEPAALFDEADERMVRPEDVAPPVVERDDEDSKTTWQG